MSTSRIREIEILIDLIAKLPGLGPRSARSAVLHLIRKKSSLFTPLSKQMAKVAEQARECLNCGNIGTSDICELCEDQKRINGQICVVEDVCPKQPMPQSNLQKILFVENLLPPSDSEISRAKLVPTSASQFFTFLIKNLVIYPGGVSLDHANVRAFQKSYEIILFASILC